MTTEAYPGAPSYTISGTGPYNIGHSYGAAADIGCVVSDPVLGTRIELDPADFSVAPAGPADDGDVTLTSAAATTHDGLTLTIVRSADVEQGWEGQNSREDGLEAQLDALTRALQDRARELGSSLRADQSLKPFVPVEGYFVSFDENLDPVVVSLLEGDVAASAYMASLLLTADRPALLAALSAKLAAFDGLSGAADKLAYFTAAEALALADFTAAARTLLAADSQTAQRAAIGASYASQAQAEAGAINTVVMSPLRTAEAIAAQTYTPLSGPNIAAGTTQVWLDTTQYDNEGSEGEETILIWRFAQSGTIRVGFEASSLDSTGVFDWKINGVGVATLSRPNNGAWTDHFEDITVARGDLLTLTLNATGSAGDFSRARNIYLATDGGPLFPSLSQFFTAANFA